MNKYPGSCLCRQVTFEVRGDFAAFYLCHCSRCRKATGTVHGANLFAKAAELVWLSGQEQVRLFKVPDTRFVKSFCVTCGAALPSLDEGRLVVPAGSLDSEPGVKPTAHIFCGSQAAWEQDLAKLTRYEGRPE